MLEKERDCRKIKYDQCTHFETLGVLLFQKASQSIDQFLNRL
jgi:hypothetical protein